MNLGFSPMMSLNLTPISLPAKAKPGSAHAIDFPQAISLVQKVPTTQVTPVTQVSAVERGGSTNTASSQPITESTPARDPVEEFKKYMAMSPAEKMRYAVLADAGLTMEEYQSLPPEEKEKIDVQISERLENLREAREINNNRPRAIAQYQMEMQRDLNEDYRANPTSIFV